MSSESQRGRLPFEPRQNKKKKPKKEPAAVNNTVAEQPQKVTKSKANKSEASIGAIPNTVSKRMARRMAMFCTIPTGLGMLSFVLFYLIKTNNLLELPSFVPLIVSISFFGIGMVGLSYGILSASWDEKRAGTWLGVEEFKINWQRMIAAWRNSRKTTQED
jgi:hypothetical protein